ncbi:hypothetical protein DFJ73DRAFT_797645, partial [Zopfochytrium polystomum]
MAAAPTAAAPEIEGSPSASTTTTTTTTAAAAAGPAFQQQQHHHHHDHHGSLRRTRHLVEIAAPASAADVALLRALRRQCGWDEERVGEWVEEAGRGARRLFFVVAGGDGGVKEGGEDGGGGETRDGEEVVGMISLLVDSPAEPHIACAATRTACITSLYIRDAFQRRGLGGAAFAELERLVAAEGATPTTPTTTTTTTTSTTTTKPPTPIKTTTLTLYTVTWNACIYERRGYVEFRRDRRFEGELKGDRAVAVYLRKEV